MAHRCRTCGEPHFAVNASISYPLPERLARLDPLLTDLLEAAREFTSFGPGNALDFVEWLSIGVRVAARRS